LKQHLFKRINNEFSENIAKLKDEKDKVLLMLQNIFQIDTDSSLYFTQYEFPKSFLEYLERLFLAADKRV